MNLGVGGMAEVSEGIHPFLVRSLITFGQFLMDAKIVLGWERCVALGVKFRADGIEEVLDGIYTFFAW